MKRSPANPSEQECPACNGSGFAVVVQPVHPTRKIFPPRCKECGGKGRVEADN
jgi:DnaJ-class molecular chaperone